MRAGVLRALALFGVSAMLGCSVGSGSTPPPEAVCAFPAAPVVLHDQEGSVLLLWRLAADSVFSSGALPADTSLLAYRAAIERDGADVRRPVADPPIPLTEAEAEIWRNEHFNNDLVFEQGIGSVEPVTCLDALLFSVQAARYDPIARPAEFVANVLRRPQADEVELAVVFGAGAEMFPPREVYGVDIVRQHLDDGWEFAYVLHNHTPQRNGDRLALGVPAPSTSDVGLARGLGESLQLDSVRVTNGFYTFLASVEDLAQFRTR